MDKFIVKRKADGGYFSTTIYPASSNYLGIFDTLEEAYDGLKKADEGKYVIYRVTEETETYVEIKRKVFGYNKVEL